MNTEEREAQRELFEKIIPCSVPVKFENDQFFPVYKRAARDVQEAVFAYNVDFAMWLLCVESQPKREIEETNNCALKHITDRQVELVCRAFWRRIDTYKNDYERELPRPLPVEFMAHMATALTFVDSPIKHDP